MTRACTNSRPGSPKSTTTSTGSQPLRMPKERGVSKKCFTSVAQASFKAMKKSHSKEECFAVLKNLLPASRQKQSVSELALVEETIAYIAYLEQILQGPTPEQSECDVSATMLMLQKLRCS